MNYKTETQRRIAEVLEELGFNNVKYIEDKGYFIINSDKIIIVDEKSKQFLIGLNTHDFTVIYVNNDQFTYMNDNSPVIIKSCKGCNKFYFGKKIARNTDECPYCKSKSIRYLSNDGKIPGWYGREKDIIIDLETANKHLEILDDETKEKIIPAINRLAGTPKYIYVTHEKIKQLDELRKKYPNMIEVIDYIFQSITLLTFKKNKQLSFKPILLVGSPGCGKTSFVYELGKILMGWPILKIDLGNCVANFTISGSDPSYRKAHIGIIAESMFCNSDGQPIKNPIIHFDELDKINKEDSNNIETIFYSILEKNTAKNFYENFISMNIDASGVNYIFTANELDKIAKPILNRLHVFQIPEYTHEQLYNVVLDNFYKNWIKNNCMNPEYLPEVLLPEIKEKILAESHDDPRSIEDAIGKVFNETITTDTESKISIALFSPREIYEGWQNYRGHKSISEEKWELPLNFKDSTKNPFYQIEF